MCDVLIRDAGLGDVSSFATIFLEAIDGCAGEAFTPGQVEAWSASAADARAFGHRMLLARAFLAEMAGNAVGFATLEADGRVGMLYVRGDVQRRGVGVRLLAAVVEAARAAGLSRLHAEASDFSRGTFERAGFRVTGLEQIERHGEIFTRHLVSLDLSAAE